MFFKSIQSVKFKNKGDLEIRDKLTALFYLKNLQTNPTTVSDLTGIQTTVIRKPYSLSKKN